MLKTQPRRIAVVGAGIAGAACAQALAAAGHDVHVFDKARGPGGRLASRRFERPGPAAEARAGAVRLDHGAIGFSASTPRFQAFVEQSLQAGWLAEWQPLLSADSLPLEPGERFFLPAPESPALCRHLLQGVTTTWSFTVGALLQGECGWQLQAADGAADSAPGQAFGVTFDAVLLALPPAQAAPLLKPCRSDWARHAAVTTMQPCWTFMGMTDEGGAPPAWTLARPPDGPLAWVLRNDARPGRTQVAGQAQWVAHARAGWSRKHLEQTSEWVLQQLQDAVSSVLGGPQRWTHAAVHRWRYALPAQQTLTVGDACWWDAAHGIGACGDFLGGQGVEGSWLSAQALAAAVLRSGSLASAVTSQAATSQTTRRADSPTT